MQEGSGTMTSMERLVLPSAFHEAADFSKESADKAVRSFQPISLITTNADPGGCDEESLHSNSSITAQDNGERSVLKSIRKESTNPRRENIFKSVQRLCDEKLWIELSLLFLFGRDVHPKDETDSAAKEVNTVSSLFQDSVGGGASIDVIQALFQLKHPRICKQDTPSGVTATKSYDGHSPTGSRTSVEEKESHLIPSIERSSSHWEDQECNSKVNALYTIRSFLLPPKDSSSLSKSNAKASACTKVAVARLMAIAMVLSTESKDNDLEVPVNALVKILGAVKKDNENDSTPSATSPRQTNPSISELSASKSREFVRDREELRDAEISLVDTRDGDDDSFEQSVEERSFFEMTADKLAHDRLLVMEVVSVDTTDDTSESKISASQCDGEHGIEGRTHVVLFTDTRRNKRYDSIAEFDADENEVVAEPYDDTKPFVEPEHEQTFCLQCGEATATTIVTLAHLFRNVLMSSTILCNSIFDEVGRCVKYTMRGDRHISLDEPKREEAKEKPSNRREDDDSSTNSNPALEVAGTARRSTKELLDISKFITIGTREAATRVVYNVGVRIRRQKVGKKLMPFQLGRHTIFAVGKITLATLGAAFIITEAIFEAAMAVGKKGADVTADVVRYRYGVCAAKVVEETSQSVENTVRAIRFITLLEPITLTKSIAKNTGRRSLPGEIDRSQNLYTPPSVVAIEEAFEELMSPYQNSLKDLKI